MRFALALRVDRPLLVGAASVLVADALAACPLEDRRPARALETSRRWVLGQADGVTAWASGFAAMEAVLAARDARGEDAVRAAGCLAFACDDHANDAYYAHQGYAALAVAHAAFATEEPLRAARRIRERIGLAELLPALDRAAVPPAPLPGPMGPADDSFYC